MGSPVPKSWFELCIIGPSDIKTSTRSNLKPTAQNHVTWNGVGGYQGLDLSVWIEPCIGLPLQTSPDYLWKESARCLCAKVATLSVPDSTVKP